jgi:hypothetical protein
VLLVFVFLPFVIQAVSAAILQVILLAYFLAWELTAITAAKAKVPKSPLCNVYLFMQIATGLLKKASLLGLGLVGGTSMLSEKSLGTIVGAVAIIGIILD